MRISTDTRFLGTIEVDTDKIAPPVLEYLIRYGLKQSVDDAGADPKKGAKGSRERFDDLLAGNVPAGGGARLSPMERALRQVVEDHLRAAGVKAAAAAKAAKEPEKAFRALIAEQLGRKLGLPSGKVAANLVDKNEAKLWPSVVAKAEKIVAASEAETDFEIEAA